MAILTVHHRDQHRDRGVRELRRVARGPVVILTFDQDVGGAMWLVDEYLCSALRCKIVLAQGALCNQ